MKSTHELLFKATRDLHHDLNQIAVLTRLLSPDLTRAQYIQALSSLCLAFNSVESALEHYEKTLVPVDNFKYQKRAEFLAADLISLEIDLDPINIETTLSIRSPADYLGACYVLEGASLGSAYIAQHIESQHPEIARLAFRYWSFQQKHAANWPVFLGKLASLDSDASLQEKAIASATLVFEVFIKQMQATLNAK